MGLPTDYGEYEEGDECPLCAATLFGGVTPKYVEAHVVGVDVCPGGPAFDPNGTWRLEQIAPCQWLGGAAGWGFVWILNPGESSFTIVSGPVFLFAGISVSDCVDVFINQQFECDLPFTAGVGGTVDVFWGPTIGV